MIKKIFFLIFLLSHFRMLYAVNNPNDPKDPKVGTDEKASSQVPKNQIKVKVFFSDKNIVFEGTASIKNFKIFVTSEKNGFEFYKEFTLENIQSVSVKKWQGFKYKDNAFVFYPSEYEIKDLKGISFIYKKNIQELNDFVLETDLGKTKIFSYFYDYWTGKEWEMSKRKSQELSTGEPLPKVAVKLFFISISQKEEKKI
ncbi:MAG TPA: hypothetical protein DHW82_08655 [Spirochaetia bacterium]|nr:MAG: hypothetical protein A2Y41_05015 [Spirochaetes bacterium GWB1_36_13]HCL57060.1 hypothetical protein [Spirochaetia bacterium]